MKIARFLYEKKEKWGIVDDDRIKVLRTCPFEGICETKKRIPLGSIKLLAPSEPSKIILVGLNYYDHAGELNMTVPAEPVIFMKPSTSVIGPQEDILYAEGIQRLDYEAELAAVIGKAGKNIKESEAGEYIFGYTCLNDVTARDVQKKDGQWTRAKSYDTFCPVGPWMETELDPANLMITSRLNSQVRQHSSTSRMIFSVPMIVSFVSRIMTLFAGDIISTGTPAGVGEMKDGDNIEIEIQGIGALSNRVVCEKKHKAVMP